MILDCIREYDVDVVEALALHHITNTQSTNMAVLFRVNYIFELEKKFPEVGYEKIKSSGSSQGDLV